MSAVWWQNEGETLILKLYCQPGARRDGIEGLHGERLKVRLGAPAIGGKANDCLRRFLALEFAVARREVTLLSGERSREKQIAVHSPRRKPRWFQDLTDPPTT
ncbi:MAG: DUF167 family protein [Gammaproteobacteria bacterium]